MPVVDPTLHRPATLSSSSLTRANCWRALPEKMRFRSTRPVCRKSNLNHRGPRCTFEAIIEDYHLQAPGLARLALIVRAADIKGQEQVAVEGIGLRAIAQGFAALGLSDEERLARQFPVYDALYEYARQTP